MGGTYEFVGRESEQHALVEALEDTVSSRGSTVVLRGVPGIGKTALLRRGLRHAETLGLSVLSMTAAPNEARLPYAGVDQLLRTLAGGPPVGPMPSWATLDESVSPVERYRLALDVLTAVTAGTGKGRLLVVDDAQWLDRESWDVLSFVGRRIAQDKVCLLLGRRDGEETADLLSGSGLPELNIEPLSAEAAAELLHSTSPGLAPALARRVLAEAAGNPLGLIELGTAAEALGDGDATSRRTNSHGSPRAHLRPRTMSHLPLLTQSMVLIAALDDSIQVGELLGVGVRLHGQHITVDELRPAVTAGLIVVDGESVQFRHPLIRGAVASAASTSVRLATHAAIADTLHGQEARQIWHRAAGTLGTDREVADRLASLAVRAGEQGSPETALRAWSGPRNLPRPDRSGCGDSWLRLIPQPS